MTLPDERIEQWSISGKRWLMEPGGRMSDLKAEEVLCVASEQIGSFIRDQASSRTLTPLVRRLNEDLLGDDIAASELAARPLCHLGFVVRA
jgi:hypothetical protein